MKLAVFDTHTYDREALAAANVRYGHDLTFFEPRPTPDGFDGSGGPGCVLVRQRPR